MKFLEELAAQRRFGMRPGLETIRRLTSALGDPQLRLGRVIHVAGTNGKGAVTAILDAALRGAGVGRVGRYTSPHLVKLNERFFLDGAPIDDVRLEAAGGRVFAAVQPSISDLQPVTFFEALTAVAFTLYAEAQTDYVVLETGLGGRLDATNICEPTLSVITRIGLDHCDWLGDTVEKIAAEKGGIIKPGVPVVLGRNEPPVIEVLRRIAAEKDAPFYYAPDLVSEREIPDDFPLKGSFNREHALTAFAALKVLSKISPRTFSPFTFHFSLSNLVWPGRFQLAGGFLIDGAHNPPAATALAAALAESYPGGKFPLVAGFCGDKDVVATLRILAPFASEGLAVKTNNPRSLAAADTAAKMREAGIAARESASLAEALAAVPPRADGLPRALVCGSLFLAGEALFELGAYPWQTPRFDPSEALRRTETESR